MLALQLVGLFWKIADSLRPKAWLVGVSQGLGIGL